MEPKELLKQYGRKKVGKENGGVTMEPFNYKSGAFTLNEVARSENQREYGVGKGEKGEGLRS